MPFLNLLPSMTASLLGLLLLPSLVSADALSCPANSPLSCHNTTTVQDTCCFNSPGGTLLQTQFWDTTPSAGPPDSWTIHGLWPDNCDGSYEQFCDSSRQYTNITAILESFAATDLLEYMNTYWVSDEGSNESLWEHEWGKHGTCVSTLYPNCYDAEAYTPQQEVLDFFNRTVSLFKTLDTYQFLAAANIVPSTTATYALADVQTALSNPRNGVAAYVTCLNGELDQAWYYFNVAGSVQTGEFVATAPTATGSCPAKGVRYLPKKGSAEKEEL